MTDRFALPASVIEDARAHPEKYRPEVADVALYEKALLLDAPTDWERQYVGAVGEVRLIDSERNEVGVTFPDNYHATATAWLPVGGVEQGPRPEVGGRVIALAGAVSTGIWIVTSYTDGGGLLASQPMKPNEEVFITEWALLPEADDDEHVIPDECTEPCDHASIGEQRVRRSSIHPRGIGKPTVEDDGMGEATAATDGGAAAADEARRWSDALGFGDGITEPAASLSDVAHRWEQLKYDANDHAECPFWCDDCEQWEKRYSCGACNGSGCGPGTALGAYDPCRECGGDATDHRAYKLTSSDEGRTVGSLGAGDVGSTMTALGLALVIDQITHYRDEYDGELRVGITGRRGRFDDEQSFPADTPCRVSDGPGEG